MATLTRFQPAGIVLPDLMTGGADGWLLRTFLQGDSHS